MKKNTAKIFGLAATTLFCAGSLGACAFTPDINEEPTVYGPPPAFDMEESAPSITSKWKIESWTLNGVTSYPQPEDDESVLPKFNSDDGATFFLTVTGENEYRGDLIPQADGTYQLKHGDNENILTAEIDGNKLTITLPSGTCMTFVTEE